MIVALTGASGHIGSNLIRELLSLGHQVKVLLHKDNRAFKGLEIAIIRGTLHEKESLVKLFKGSEIVFHLAALISIGKNGISELTSTNVEGTKHVIECCKLAGVRRLVHFSSIHALFAEKHCTKLDESSPLNLESKIPYERTKAISEHVALEEAHKNGLELVVVNPTAVIGPWDFGPSFLGQFLIRLYQGKIPALLHGGYNWVDARDVSKGAIAAAMKGVSGERYILSGTWADLKAFVEMWSKVTGQEISLPLLPHALARIGIPFIQLWAKLNKNHPLYTSESLEIIRTGCDNIPYTKAQKELNYSPRPLIETLKDSYYWYQTNSYI